jgi:cell division protein FtsB
MKKIIFFTVLGVAIFSMIHSVQSMYSLWQKKDIIAQMQKDVQKEQEENTKLKKQLQIVSQPSFVESEARNKLFMTKPGEETVFIPKDALASHSGVPQEVQEHLSNWHQWWNVFF